MLPDTLRIQSPGIRSPRNSFVSPRNSSNNLSSLSSSNNNHHVDSTTPTQPAHQQPHNKEHDNNNNKSDDELPRTYVDMILQCIGDESFVGVFFKFREFRLCLISYCVALLGEWLTYVASISLIENILLAKNEQSRTAISTLVVVRLLPHIAFSPFGGVLADSHDRRNSMITLDCIGAAVPLLFLVAMKVQSIQLIYWVMFLKECVASLYEPSRSAIVPLLVPDEKYLQKATTLSEGMWSVMAAVGKNRNEKNKGNTVFNNETSRQHY